MAGRRAEITEQITRRLGLPVFVKPANLGSSVGITKVKSGRELAPAVEEALQYDFKIIVEKAIVGWEIEVSVLGNENPGLRCREKSSPPQITTITMPTIDNRSRLIIPAQLSDALTAEIRTPGGYFRVVDAVGLARWTCL